MANERSGTIVAGTGDLERTFQVPQSALEKSPVIKGWIDDKDSIHPSVLRNGALYFPECDPEVVHATVEYLRSTTLTPSAVESKDVLFHVRMYKFAICLGLDELCGEVLKIIQDLVCSTQAFLDVLQASTEEKTSIVDDCRFHKSMLAYMARNSDKLKTSNFFKTALMNDSGLA